MKHLTLDEFGDHILELFPKLMQEITRHENNYVTKGKITLPQLMVLQFLSQKNEYQMSELAESINVSFSTATGMINRLIKHGLVSRRHGVKDRRAVIVTITNKGKSIVKEVYAQKRKGMIELFKRLSQKERSTYIGIIKKLVQKLSASK